MNGLLDIIYSARYINFKSLYKIDKLDIEHESRYLIFGNLLSRLDNIRIIPVCPRCRNLSSSLHRIQYLFVTGSRCPGEHETWRQESCYVDGERFRGHSFTTRGVRTRLRARNDAIGDARPACGPPRIRVRVHFVTHSCIFHSEQFATRTSLSRQAVYE
jgi:hypothetical protein